jgi:flagellar motor protein MotB/flagellar hook assembly protein FlgD
MTRPVPFRVILCVAVCAIASSYAIKSSAEALAVEPSAIGVDTEGFWPSSESRIKSVSISTFVGNAKDLRSWKVEIFSEGAKGQAVQAFTGKAGDAPSVFVWDGTGSDGKLAAEGRYVALLSATYSDSSLPSLSIASKPFSLSLSGPEPILVIDPQRLEPMSGGVKAPLSFEIDGRSVAARLKSWRLDIVGADGKVFRAYAGEWPVSGVPAALSWDGTSESGALVQPGRRYAVILSLSDEYGHPASTQGTVSVADLPYAPERSSVQPWTNGFSPDGHKVMDEMDFSLAFGQRASVRSWRLDIAHEGKGLVVSFRGSAPDLPSSLAWDGKTASGATAPEGRYTATLAVDYGSDFSPALARSAPFVLELSPPALSLSSSTKLFSPDASGSGGLDGPDSTLTLGLVASSRLGRIVDWSIEVIDPGEQVFKSFGGPWPSSGSLPPIEWDGIGTDGSLIASAESYRLVARCRDEFGNSSEARSGFDTDILVLKDGDRYRVDVASIVFRGNTDDFEHVPPEQAAQNRLTLDRLAAKFSKFPGYRIRLVGHAVMINWDDPSLGKSEQEKALIPLSRARAAAIAKALAERGIEASRMSIEGVGASKQVVPDSDTANRWKNRRVEFYLEK